MKKKLRLIVTAFSVSFVIMAALSLYAVRQFNAMTSYSGQVDHTNQVITNLYHIESLVKELDIKESGFVLTKDSTYINGLYGTMTELQPSLARIKALTEQNDVQAKTFIMLKSAIALRIADLKNDLRYMDTTHTPGLSEYFSLGRTHKTECLTYISQMINREGEVLKDRFVNKKYYEQIATNTLVYMLTGFGVVTLVLFILMIHELKKRFIYQDELQTKLVDLKRSHAELEQIAFAASHDLQEPLRKIQVFSDRLSRQKKDEGDETKDTIERITAAAGRMQELIEDMVNLTSLIKKEGEKEPVDLNHILKTVLTDMDDRISTTNAVIHREVLPELKGYPRQFYILFKSLLDNSLKFRQENIDPVIAIRADKILGSELSHINKDLAAKTFYRITVSDNGIGFDNKFISKMFRIFQRLHNQQSEYEGKGIGLAICQRIMVNHEGYIIAHGHPEAGATFKLFFPAEG